MENNITPIAAATMEFEKYLVTFDASFRVPLPCGRGSEKPSRAARVSSTSLSFLEIVVLPCDHEKSAVLLEG